MKPHDVSIIRGEALSILNYTKGAAETNDTWEVRQ